MATGTTRHAGRRSPRPGELSNEPRLSSLAIFRHVQSHQYIYEALVRGRGMELLFLKGQRALAQSFEQHLHAWQSTSAQSTVPLPLLADYLAGALLTLLKWWLDNELPYPPERMDALFQELVLPGVRAAVYGQTSGNTDLHIDPIMETVSVRELYAWFCHLRACSSYMRVECRRKRQKQVARSQHEYHERRTQLLQQQTRQRQARRNSA